MLRSLRIENLVLIRDAELDFAPGLNAITGETGAGKTILAQSIGLLLGARADAAMIGPGGDETYVEAELDGEHEALEELRPEGEHGLVLARRIFRDGRTRAYAWGRASAREDVAAAAEQAIAMSGQFQQRRLSRPAFQLDVLDAFAETGELRAAMRSAWRDLSAARRRHAGARRRRSAAGGAPRGAPRARRGHGRARAGRRVRPARAARAGAPPRGARLRCRRGRRRARTGRWGRSRRPRRACRASRCTAGVARARARTSRRRAPRRRAASPRDRVGAALVPCRSLGGAGRLEEIESQLERISDAKRRFRCETYDELLARAEAAKAELDALDAGVDPAEAAAKALADAEARVRDVAAELHSVREGAAPRFAGTVSAELAGLGMGGGELEAIVSPREPGPTGADEVQFLIRPNPGLAFAPVADTASGGELSRIALAIAIVAGGETLVFDEIDAGIGGETANAVGRALARAAEKTQVIAITHLPQIASLAERHFRVEKVPGDPTHTRIEQLAADERSAELERMLGGAEFLETLKQ